MLAFDLAELRKDGVDVGPLPDEDGRLIDATALPPTFTHWLRRYGFDTTRPLRISGVIQRRPGGGLGHYCIRFEQG
jgi:hypothetical protein